MVCFLQGERTAACARQISYLEQEFTKGAGSKNSVEKLTQCYFQGLLVRGGAVSEKDPLKKPGYIPIISTVSGVYRVAKSILILCHDLIVFPLTTIFCYVHARAQNGLEHKRSLEGACTQLCDTLRALAVDMRNIVRGITEMVPIAGNLVCYGCDKVSDWYRKRRGYRFDLV